MSRIFFTSDLHFMHYKRILYESRGYKTAKSHMYDIIWKWNNLIKSDDIVYILGDLTFGKQEETIQQIAKLNGNLEIIRGNHDTDARWQKYGDLPNVELLGWADYIDFSIVNKRGIVRKYKMYLSHYPTLTWNYDSNLPLYKRVINLCGHTHKR